MLDILISVNKLEDKLRVLSRNVANETLSSQREMSLPFRLRSEPERFQRYSIAC
jgi:hypothetical protein